jgi:hypothetical protein
MASILAGSGRASYRVRYNFARLLGGSTEGPGNIGLLQTNYAASENFGSVYVKLLRENGTLGQAEATFNIPPRDGDGDSWYRPKRGRLRLQSNQSAVHHDMGWYPRIEPRYLGHQQHFHGCLSANPTATAPLMFTSPSR